MSTIVYHEQQSSFHESFFFESRTLSLKLNSSNNFSQTRTTTYQEEGTSKTEYVPKSASSSNSNTSGSFSSIEALSSKKDGKESVYVHPLVKRSAFTLSDQSLQMCTESLGSETGSCDMRCSIFSPPMTVEERQPQHTIDKVKVQKRNPQPKYEKTTNKDVLVDHGKFPPPLTTISGSNPMQVKPHRENGRLVIQAVTPPPARSYMQSERSDGILKLTLVSNDFSDDEEDNVDNDDDCSCDCQSESTDNNNYNGLKSMVESVEQQQQKEVEENTEKEEELKGCNNKSNACLLEDGISGKKLEFGVKLRLGKMQTISRCKERGQGNKKLINWEPFWVAI